MAKSAKPQNKPTGRRSLQEYITALEMAHGYPSKAAELLGVTPAAVTNRIKRNKRLQKLSDDLKQNRLTPMLDKAESNLVEALNNGEAWATKYVLDYHGADRGFGVRKISIDAQVESKPPELKVIISPPEGTEQNAAEPAS